MFLKPKPRWRALLCAIAGGHTPEPLTYTTEIDGLSGILETFTVTDPYADRCSTCGRVDPTAHAPSELVDQRRLALLAGVRTIIGPELADEPEWGDRRIHRPGLLGVREDYNEPPAETRAEWEQTPQKIRQIHGGPPTHRRRIVGGAG